MNTNIQKGNGGGWKRLPPFLFIVTKKDKDMSKKKEVLKRKLARLEHSLSKEQTRTTQVMNNIGWGTGMRCTKCTPSLEEGYKEYN